MNQRRNNHVVSHSPSPLSLKSSGFRRSLGGSITLSMKLDKDSVECCVCLSSMTGHIYRCKGITPSTSSSKKQCQKRKHPGHNICSSCEWQMRRLKKENGHIKTMECPICKVRGPFERNTSLERELAKLSEPCCHAAAGCTQRFFPWDESRKMHEEYLCKFQSVDCPFCHQSIPGGRANFVEHLNKSTAKLSNSTSSSIVDNANRSNSVQPHDHIENNNPNDSSDSDYYPSPIVTSEDEQNLNTESDVELNDDTEEPVPPPPMEQKDESNDNSQPVIPPCSMQFHQLTSTTTNKQIVGRGRNEFMVNEKLGIAFCFIAPSGDCPCWKVYALSIDPRHSLCGNSRVYIQYVDHERFWNCQRKEAIMGSQCAQYIAPPPMHTLTLQLGRLHPTALRQKFNSYPVLNSHLETAATNQSTKIEKQCDVTEDANPNDHKMETDSDYEMTEEQKESDDDGLDLDELDLDEYEPTEHLGHSPCSQIQCEYIYGGHAGYGQRPIEKLSIRVYSLEQSLKVGCIIDARDFRGEWFEASILILEDRSGTEFKRSDVGDRQDALEIRRAKIHYLGYSGGYDEWIDIDTDSHRLAHRGTFTVGPNLRAIRKHSTKRRGTARSAQRARAYTAVISRRRIAVDRGGTETQDTDDDEEEVNMQHEEI